MGKRRKSKAYLASIKRTVCQAMAAGTILLLIGAISLLSNPEQREWSGDLRSWSVESIGSRAGNRNTESIWFQVDVGGRLLRIDYIPNSIVDQGTPYYASEMRQILESHVGETVHCIYRHRTGTIVHMETVSEVIVDQNLVLALEKRDDCIPLVIGAFCIGFGLLLIPYYYYLILKRRQTHGRISARRADRTAARSRRRKIPSFQRVPDARR